MTTSCGCGGVGGVHVAPCPWAGPPTYVIGGIQAVRCARGEHEATTNPSSTAGIAVWLGERAAEAWVCRHCRAVFVPRPA